MGLSEMVGSALVQELVSRVVSSVLGKRKEREAQRGHDKDNMERLDMAILGMEFALEMSAKRPITDLSLLQMRNKIRCAYAQAKELRQDTQKLLKAADVARLERFADWAHKFVGDVESSCSLSRNNLCNNRSIIVRHLFEGRSLRGRLVQGNQRRYVVDISPSRSGFEAVLVYSYKDDNYTTVEGKTFYLMLILRLSGSTDVVGVAIKGLQYLASQFKLLPAESALGELTLLPTLLLGLAPSRVSWEVDDAVSESIGTMLAQHWRPDPACCRQSTLGLCSSSNNAAAADVSFSSEFSHVFPEEVIWFSFRCYISAAAVEPPNSSRSMVGWTPPPPPLVEVSVFFAPHYDQSWAMQHGGLAMVQAGDVLERRDASLQQVSETLKPDAISCFLRQPELTEYRIGWSSSRHGSACFVVERPRIQLTRREYEAKCQEIDRCRFIGCASF